MSDGNSWTESIATRSARSSTRCSAERAVSLRSARQAQEQAEAEGVGLQRNFSRAETLDGPTAVCGGLSALAPPHCTPQLAEIERVDQVAEEQESRPGRGAEWQFSGQLMGWSC